MVVLGGATRLTGSGLSMVKWEPITGVLPPLSQEQWTEVFELYRQSPEYKLKNLDKVCDPRPYSLAPFYWWSGKTMLSSRISRVPSCS